MPQNLIERLKKEMEKNMNEIIEWMKHAQMERICKLSILNLYAKKGQILLTGSSLMEQFPIEELLYSKGLNTIIYNRGVGGFTTTDMLNHMEEMVFGTEPSKIFINIGSNDIGALDFKLEDLLGNYRNILQQAKARLPQAKLYVMAYYPVNEIDKVPEGEWGKEAFVNRNNQTIEMVNLAVQQLAKELDCNFINVNLGLTDEYGRLKKEYTVEGIHMYGNAYWQILDNMLPFIME